MFCIFVQFHSLFAKSASLQAIKKLRRPHMKRLLAQGHRHYNDAP